MPTTIPVRKSKIPSRTATRWSRASSLLHCFSLQETLHSFHDSLTRSCFGSHQLEVARTFQLDQLGLITFGGSGGTIRAADCDRDDFVVCPVEEHLSNSQRK